MARVNTLDLLSQYTDKDYINEYKKIIDLIDNWGTYNINGEKISVKKLFNMYVIEWKYRNTYTCLEDIYEKLKINKRPTVNNIKDKLLMIIELFLNIDYFLDEKIASINKQNKEYEFAESYNYIERNDFIIYENCKIIIKSLGYKIRDINNKITLIKIESDVSTTITEINNSDLEELLVDYISFRNKNDSKEKKRILVDIANCLEPLRKDIPNSDLENTIFKLFNKINIRHNNKEGNNKVEFVSKMSVKEEIEWYDKCFYLCLTAFRLIDFKKNKAIYDSIK